MKPDQEAESASYWRRHVPASAAVSLAGGLLLPVPIVNALAVVGVPAMLAMLASRREEGVIVRWLPAVVPLMVVLPVAELRLLVLWPLALVLAAIILDVALRGGWEWRLAAVAVAVPPGAAFAGLWYGLMGETGVREQMTEFWPSYSNLLSSLGFDPAAFEAGFEKSVELTLYVAPSQFAVTAIMAGLMTVAVTLWWQQRSGTETKIEIEPFSCWELPRWLLIPLGVSLLVTLAGGVLARVGANTAIVIAFLYFLQGFAIIWYSFEVRGTSQLIRLLFALLAIIIFPGLVILGVLETVFPLRRLMARAVGENTEEGSDESDPSGGSPAPR